jgi:hypothetical protein
MASQEEIILKNKNNRGEDILKKVANVVLSFALVFVLSSFFNVEQASAVEWNVPYVGQVKTVTVKISKSQLKRYYQQAKITNKTLDYVNEFIAGYAGYKAKSALQGGLIGVGVYTLIELMGLGTEKQMKETKAILEKMKKKKATYLIIKQKYRYSYMSGAGTGWFPYGKADVSYK